MTDWNKVLTCWGPVEADYSAYAVATMIRMFTQHPETQNKFTRFAGVPTNELPGNAAFVAAAVIVMKKLGELVKCKGNHSAVLDPVSSSHATKKISTYHMRLMAAAIGEVLGEKSGLDSAGQETVIKALNVIIDDVVVAYKQLGFTG